MPVPDVSKPKRLLEIEIVYDFMAHGSCSHDMVSAQRNWGKQQLPKLCLRFNQDYDRPKE